MLSDLFGTFLKAIIVKQERKDKKSEKYLDNV